MSSPFQILDNRSIDQWKVTELKEELRRRKLTIRGLKEDLVKRLDEAVRLERESAQSESDNGVESESEPSVAEKVVQSPQAVVPENLKGTVDDDGEKTGNVDNHAGPVNQDNIQEGYVLVEKDSATVEETVVVHETTVEETVVVTKSVKSEVPVREQDFTDTEVKDESGNSKPELVSDHPEPQVEKESGDSRTQLETDNSKPQLENNKNSEPKFEDVMLDASAPRNQVYEVSPNLGSPVKCDSISTDSVSINEKIEIKDNIIADNVKLELDNIKPSTVDPVRGESHPRPMDVEEPHESNASVEEKDDDINDTDADLSKKFDSLDDVGDSEKLNLDRSSGDESMEEDVLESKQVDSKYRPDDLGDGGEKTDVSAVNEGGCVDIMGDDTPTDKKGLDDGNNDHPFAPAEKRKLSDQALVGNNEHVKRQRRWNSESLKVPEPQSSNLSLSTTPKDTFQSPASKGFSKVDPVTPDDAPKERVVPPSPKSPTNSLRIDRFLRPFTLKAVQELLGKTGNVVGFWMDHIKTHCYVTYSSVEEAIETRSAVYNLQWPPNGGRLLLAEFVDPQEVKTRLEAPQAPAATTVPAVPPTPPGGSQPQPSPRQPRQQQLQQVIQQTAGPASLPPPPPPTLSNPPQATRERLPHPPPPPPLEEKLDPPIVTLDDLFRKTKASPRIYYLPLSEEQVAPKLAAAQGKSATKQ